MYESGNRSPEPETLPEKYTFPRIKEFPRRTQENNQLCWAYASLGCVEYKMVQQYSELDSKRLLFSRVHMRYSCFDNFKDAENSWGINANLVGGPKPSQFRQCVEAYFSRHSGPVYEFQEPTPRDTSLKERTFKEIEEDKIKPYFVSGFGAVNEELDTEQRIRAIKRAVKEHGAVFTNIRYDNAYLKNNTYYVMPQIDDSEEQAGCHAVMIVGWDDTINKNCFLNSDMLQHDGAFLIRDSSITGTEALDFNYWISYDDKYLLRIDCYVRSVDRWYDEFRLYQHNYFGVYMLRKQSVMTKSDIVCFKVNYKRDKSDQREVIRSVVLSNASVETNVDVVLVRKDSTEETLISGLCMEEIGYGTYPVQSKDDNGNPKEVFLESGEKEFTLKVTYSRNAVFDVPMELSPSQRESMAKRATEMPEGEQYLFTDGEFQDVSKKSFIHKVSRLGIKLITEPASEKWSQLKNYVDNFTVGDTISPVPHNLKTNAQFSVTWEALNETDGNKIDKIRILQDTIVNESSEDKKFVLNGRFTVSDGGQNKYVINRFYYTGLSKAQITMESIDMPEAGEYQFVVKGQSPYPNTLVQIYGNEVENDDDCLREDRKIVLGSGNSSNDGTFQIQCSYVGEGKLSVFAKTEQLISLSQIMEFTKDYTEEDEEKDTGSGTKITVKKYYPKSEVGFGQILKLLVIGAAVYGGCEAYIYVDQYIRLRRGLLPEDEIPLLNTHLIHPHADEVLQDAGEPGTIFFENDVSGIRRIFKSLENSSIEGITFSMPAGMGLIGTMDKDSAIKDSKFVIRDEGSCQYFAPVDKVSGAALKNVKLTVSVMNDKAESFHGIVEACEAGKVENCVCRLLGNQDDSVMQIEKDFAGLLGSSGNTEIVDCIFEGKVKAGENASGIVGNAAETTVSSCYVNASLEGQSVSAVTAYAQTQLNVSKCMTEGSLTAANSAGAICAGFRSFDANKVSSIEDCICWMDIRIQESGKGMPGYAGGIAGIGENSECGLQIERCLVLGSVSCGMDSWIAGVAASARSCKSTVAALTSISAGQASAQISVFGDCMAEQCLCYDQIETTDGYLKDANVIDGQALTRKKTYQDLGWDFTNIWEFSENGYPYLRNMDGKISEWPFPFIHLTGLEEDGSLRAKVNTQITFTGTYGKEMSGICFQSCILQGASLQIQDSGVFLSLQENQKFALNFGTLSETGTYQFTLKYLRSGKTHLVSLPVVITD